MTLKHLLDLIEDPFYLHVVDPAPGCNDPKIKAINEGGHLYEPSEILAGKDSLPKDFLDWEITIQPWDIETLLVMIRTPRRNIYGTV